MTADVQKCLDDGCMGLAFDAADGRSMCMHIWTAQNIGKKVICHREVDHHGVHVNVEDDGTKVRAWIEQNVID